MSEPSYKAKEIDDTLKEVFGIDRRANILADTCVFCNKPALEFKDEISRTEFRISGICQQCQDGTFTESSARES